MAGTTVAEKKPTSLSTTIGAELDKLGEALPKNFNKARFVNNALALMNEQPDLIADCGQAQVVGGLMKGAILGLDFYSKECYLIKYGKTANFQIDYRGAIKLAKKYSARPVKEINGKVVREGDFFEEKMIDGKPTFDFKPKAFNNGAVVGAFAWCEFQDGGLLVETMNLDELNAIRNASKAKNAMAWTNFKEQMYIKSVIRRLLKRIQLDFENTDQVGLYQEDGAIETDTEKIVEAEISAQANQIEFEDVAFTEVSDGE